MSGGYSSETYGMGTSAEGNYNYTSEQSFVHKEWYEGVLPTPDGLPPKPIQCEDFGVYGKFVLFNNGEVHYMGYNGHGQMQETIAPPSELGLLDGVIVTLTNLELACTER